MPFIFFLLFDFCNRQKMATPMGIYEGFNLYSHVPLLVQDNADHDEKINLEDSCNSNNSCASINEGRGTDNETRAGYRELGSLDCEGYSTNSLCRREPHDVFIDAPSTALVRANLEELYPESLQSSSLEDERRSTSNAHELHNTRVPSSLEAPTDMSPTSLEDLRTKSNEERVIEAVGSPLPLKHGRSVECR